MIGYLQGDSLQCKTRPLEEHLCHIFMLQVRPHAQLVGPLKIACTNDEYLILSKKISLWRLQIAQHIAAAPTNKTLLSLSPNLRASSLAYGKLILAGLIL